MATLTADPLNETHQVPAHFIGVTYVTTTSFSEAENEDYLQYVRMMPFELLRTSVAPDNATLLTSQDTSRTSTWGSSTWNKAKHVLREMWDTHGTKWHPLLYLSPLAPPNAAGDSPSVAGDIITSSSDGRSPLGHHANLRRMRDVIAPGVPLEDFIKGWESYNEPNVEMPPYWWADGNLQKSVDWAIYHERYAHQEKIDDGGLDNLLRYAWSQSSGADTNTTVRNRLINHLDGYSGWGQPDGNEDKSDGISFHDYHSNGNSPLVYNDQQSFLNSICYPTFTADKGGFFAAATEWRAIMDARNPALKMCMSETWAFAFSFKEDSNNYKGALAEALRVIVAMKNCGDWQLEGLFVQDLAAQQYDGTPAFVDAAQATTTAAAPYTLVLEDTQASPDDFLGLPVRGMAFAEILCPFVRKYKRVIAGSISGVGNTPGGDATNAIERIQWVLGLSATGDELGLLLANADLTTNESVTFEFGATSNGQATGLKVSTSQLVFESCPALTGLPAAGATSHTFTATAGEVYRIEVPIPVAVAGGAGPAFSKTAFQRDAFQIEQRAFDHRAFQQNAFQLGQLWWAEVSLATPHPDSGTYGAKAINAAAPEGGTLGQRSLQKVVTEISTE